MFVAGETGLVLWLQKSYRRQLFALSISSSDFRTKENAPTNVSAFFGSPVGTSLEPIAGLVGGKTTLVKYMLPSYNQSTNVRI